MTNECRGCWWQEGGKCYVSPCQRDEKGYSLKMAEKRCDKFMGKRAVLSSIIPGDKLVIVSELKKD